MTDLGHLMFSWATESDGIALAENMRHEEQVEVERYSGRDPEQAIRRSIRVSTEAVSVWNPDGDLLGITGVAPFTLLGKTASPWLLNTDLMRQHPRQLLTGTKILLARWRKQYWCLVNHIDAEYEQALRWARWAGFEVADPMPLHGEVGRLFCRIEMKGEI